MLTFAGSARAVVIVRAAASAAAASVKALSIAFLLRMVLPGVSPDLRDRPRRRAPDRCLAGAGQGQVAGHLPGSTRQWRRDRHAARWRRPPEPASSYGDARPRASVNGRSKG